VVAICAQLDAHVPVQQLALKLAPGFAEPA